MASGLGCTLQRHRHKARSRRPTVRSYRWRSEPQMPTSLTSTSTSDRPDAGYSLVSSSNVSDSTGDAALTRATPALQVRPRNAVPSGRRRALDPSAPGPPLTAVRVLPFRSLLGGRQFKDHVPGVYSFRRRELRRAISDLGGRAGSTPRTPSYPARWRSILTTRAWQQPVKYETLSIPLSDSPVHHCIRSVLFREGRILRDRGGRWVGH